MKLPDRTRTSRSSRTTLNDGSASSTIWRTQEIKIELDASSQTATIAAEQLELQSLLLDQSDCPLAKLPVSTYATVERVSSPYL
jgi:hypothetical protein